MTPSGKNILAILVEFLAEQENVSITYEITEKKAKSNEKDFRRCG